MRPIGSYPIPVVDARQVHSYELHIIQMCARTGRILAWQPPPPILVFTPEGRAQLEELGEQLRAMLQG